MRKSWLDTGFTLIVAAGAVTLTAGLGLWAYVSSTAPPLHPSADDLPSVTRSTPSPGWTVAIDQARQLVRSRMASQNLPGLSVADGVDGALVWAEGFGWADLDTRVRVTPETRFRTGTASTALTSAAAGLLVQAGKLELDAPIQTYVPSFPQKVWPITVRQVMAHVAGIVSDGGDEGPLLSARCERPVDGLPHFAAAPLQFEPGTKYRSSNYGWILVSAAIEAAADQPFLRVMRKQVFEPLGMDDTGPDTATGSVPDRATPYFPRFAADPRYGPDVMRPIDYSCYAGSSVFLSTPSDLVRFGLAITRGELLQPATVHVLQTSQRLASGEETGYGLGWDLETVSLGDVPTPMAGHDGDSLGGMVASLMTFPARGLVVAVMANTSYADTFAVAEAIAQTFAAAHAAGAGRSSSLASGAATWPAR